MHFFLHLVSFIKENKELMKYFLYVISVTMGRIAFVFFKKSGAVRVKRTYNSDMVVNFFLILVSSFMLDIIWEFIGDNNSVRKGKVVSYGVIWGLLSEPIVFTMLNNSENIFEKILKKYTNRFIHHNDDNIVDKQPSLDQKEGQIDVFNKETINKDIDEGR